MGSCEFEGLATGLESEEGNVCPLSLTLPETFPPRTRSVYIGAIADDERTVKESNEGNNTDSEKVTIKRKGRP